MELTLSQFSAWSDHLNAGQLQVLISVHLLKSSNVEEIIRITKASKRNVNRIIKQLENLNLIRVRREPVIEPITHLAQDGQNRPADATSVPGVTNLAQDGQNRPKTGLEDAAFVPRRTNLAQDVRENLDIYIGVSAVPEVPNRIEDGQKRPVEDKTGLGNAAFVPGVPNLSQEGQNRPTDAAFVPRRTKPALEMQLLSQDGQNGPPKDKTDLENAAFVQEWPKITQDVRENQDIYIGVNAVPEVPNRAEDGQKRPLEDKTGLRNAAFVPGMSNLSQDGQNRPTDATSVPRGTNLAQDGQNGPLEDKTDLEDAAFVPRRTKPASEMQLLSQDGQNGPLEDKTDIENAAFVPTMPSPSEPLKSDEPNENQAEIEPKNPGSLTLQAIEAALPNLNLKNTNIKELNIDLIPEDPKYTHAHAFPVARAPVRACVSEGEESQESPSEPKSVRVSAVAVVEAPTTQPNQQGQVPEQTRPDSGQISPASPFNQAANTFGCPDYYRKFEERFQTKTLPIWRDGHGPDGIKPGFVEFIRKTLDKMGGEHTRGDAIIYIDRREKASDFVTLNARAQDWLDEEKKRTDNELERKKKMDSNAMNEGEKPLDVGDVLAQIDVELIRLKWTKKDAGEYMVKHHGWARSIAIRENRFDRLIEEDLIDLLLKLKELKHG